jgi:hypothetical protein
MLAVLSSRLRKLGEVVALGFEEEDGIQDAKAFDELGTFNGPGDLGHRNAIDAGHEVYVERFILWKDVDAVLAIGRGLGLVKGAFGIFEKAKGIHADEDVAVFGGEGEIRLKA